MRAPDRSPAEPSHQPDPDLAGPDAAAAAEEAAAKAWSRRLRRRLLATAAAALLLVAALLGAVGLRAVEQRLAVEVAATSATIGRGLAQQLETALSAGIPFGELTGVEAFLRTATAFDPRIGFAALLDAEGRLAYAAGAAAGGLPPRLGSELRTGPESDGLLWLEGHVVVPIAVRLGETAVARVLVGVEAGLPAGQLRGLQLHAALAALALLVLLLELLRALLAVGLERPTQALARLAGAVRHGDLSQTTWLAAPGPLGDLLVAARTRLAAVNARFHAFLLGAFAARAGHFEPPVLREITAVVRNCLARHRLPAVTGASLVPLADTALVRAAFFALLLGEALLLPGWRAQPALQGLGVAAAVSIVMLPLLLALPLGLLLARRLLAGFAEGLVFTAGALIAAAAQLGLALSEAPEAVVLLRLLTGLGLGLALQPLRRDRGPGDAFVAAFVAGTGPGLLALFLLGPQSVAPLAAAVTAAAGLLGGLLLPARYEPGEARETTAQGPAGAKLPGLLITAGFVGTALLAPAALAVERGPRGPTDVAALLLAGLALLLAAALGRLLAGRARPAGQAGLPAAGLAGLLLAALAAGAAAWLPAPPPPLLAEVFLVVPALLLGCAALLAGSRNRAEPAAVAAAVAGGAAVTLAGLQLGGLPLAAALAAAALLTAVAVGRRP